jgi:uracil-DNA glycosylase
LAQRLEGAGRYVPAERSLGALAAASRRCRGCTLYREATRSVFGAGAAHPRLVLVGEAPGDREDREASPFVGPAGSVLGAALGAAGIKPAFIYLSNAVKHFKFERRGANVRLHKSPSTAEVVACRPWLLAELDVTRPGAVVALGATAARSLLGVPFRVTEGRGRVLEVEDLPPVIVTYHPSAVLRAREAADREHLRTELVVDLRLAASVAEACRRRTPARARREHDG